MASNALKRPPVASNEGLGNIVQYSTLLYGSRMIFPKLIVKTLKKYFVRIFCYSDSSITAWAQFAAPLSARLLLHLSS